MDKNTIGYSSLSAIIATLLVLGGVSLTDNNIYYCEDRGIVMQCDSLSKYYGLENGKCWNSEVGNKLCKSGWIEVIDDTVIENDVPSPQSEWNCSVENCTLII